MDELVRIKRMKKNVKIVHDRLTSLAKKDPIFDDEINLYRLRIGVPATRKSMKPDYSFISKSKEDNLAVWNEVWNSSNLFEAKSQAIYFYQYKSLDQNEFNAIACWVKTCTCWEHSDDLAKIIAQVTEEHPEWTLNILRKWVKSKNSWQRRQSLVGLIEYARKRKKFLPFKVYIENVHNLLSDTDYYVQKAIGWTLREIYNAYPDECLKYKIKNLNSISSIAYSTATEKLKKQDKIRLNNLRKDSRNKSSSIKIAN